ncbi:hypothetical protein [Actinacidiphila sp. bgisy160]|uniref:hypothetical protein n=1 Tax=Actinacidiphila sp. bgisy160 TaxID=3413796 RepID=UPI003D70D807
MTELARERLHEMTARQQAFDLLELQVVILGDVPRKTRADDGISEWFRDRDRAVPLLTDEA